MPLAKIESNEMGIEAIPRSKFDRLVPQNPALESLCQTSKGTFLIVASEQEVPDQVEQACLRLLARYVIRYQPIAAGATSLGIRVQSPAGWGETCLPVPQGQEPQ